MTHWKDTVLKSSDIKWKRPRVKTVDDGKFDLNIRVPMTALMEAQAKRSFAVGARAGLMFVLSRIAQREDISTSGIVIFFNECGLPEIAERLPEKK